MQFNTYLIAGIMLTTLYSCTEKSESTVVETTTTLSINIPINVTDSDKTKSSKNTSETDYSFSGENEYSASNMLKPDKKVFNVQNIKPGNNPILSLSGIKEGDEIYALHLEWGQYNAMGEGYIKQESIDLMSYEHTREDAVFQVNLNEALTKLVKKLDDYPDNSIKIFITGKSNFNINSIANLEIPVIVESEQLDFRFGLF